MTGKVFIPVKGAKRGVYSGFLVAGTMTCLLIVGVMTAGCSRKYEQPDHYKGYDASASFGPKVGRQTNWILQQIDATDDQRSKVKTNLNDLATENAKITKEYKKMMDGLMEAFQDDQVNREAFEKIRDNSIEQFKTSSDRMVDALAAIYEVLTPAQRKKVAELWKKKNEKKD